MEFVLFIEGLYRLVGILRPFRASMDFGLFIEGLHRLAGILRPFRAGVYFGFFIEGLHRLAGIFRPFRARMMYVSFVSQNNAVRITHHSLLITLLLILVYGLDTPYCSRLLLRVYSVCASLIPDHKPMTRYIHIEYSPCTTRLCLGANKGLTRGNNICSIPPLSLCGLDL